jgi:glucokinase
MAELASIGVDIGGTNIRAARISVRGDILEWASVPTCGEAHLVTSQISALVTPLINRSVKAIGVGVPGRVDVKNERVLSGGYVDLTDHSLVATLHDTLKIPVFVDNDGNMALVAEHALGAAKGAETAVLFTIGTGIGGAVFMDGKLLRGRATAGQLGHVTVESEGELCLCGRRGCVETTSSGTALGHHLARAGLDPATVVEDLLKRAANGDAQAEDIMASWASPMRAAIDTVVAAFDPDLVVLGGGLGIAMHQALQAFPAEAEWYRCPVVPASLGDHAGVIGAALAAIAHQSH